MNTRFFKSLTAVLLILALVVPATLFAYPSVTHAQSVTGVPTNDFLDEIKNTITSIATWAQRINTYVLQPLAFVMSVGLLKAMTAGVLAFVIGQSNGTGQPQFTQNLQVTLQKVGDIQANAFFLQFGRNSNSPFATSITNSLSTSYYQKTSLAGFLAANKCTLSLASPNINTFLKGNWAQGGGAKAWFALTTQPQNNPYALYQAAESQLGSIVADAQNTRSQIIAWGQGFMSWCGTTDDGAAAAKGGSAGNGVNPGEPCTNSDGTPGTIQTPGTTIKSTLDKVLGSAQDKIVTMGQVANEVNQMMGQIATIFQTINLAQSILGGHGSGGLAGFGTNNGANSLSAYDRSAFLGITTDTVFQNSADIQRTVADAATKRVNDLESSWNTIKNAAQNASAALANLANSCPGSAAAAQDAMTNEVAPVLNNARNVAVTVASARAFIAQATDAQNTKTIEGKASYTNNLQALQDMAPTDQDVLDANQEATAHNALAKAVPPGSLNVSGGSLVDRLELVTSNAASLQIACGQDNSGGNGSIVGGGP